MRGERPLKQFVHNLNILIFSLILTFSFSVSAEELKWIENPFSQEYLADKPGLTELLDKWERATQLFNQSSREILSSNGRDLAYRVWQHPRAKALVWIMPGLGQGPQHFAELIYELYQQDFSIVSYSHRGMGESERLLPDRQKVYLDQFAFYHSDADSVFRKIVRPASGDLPIYLYAHSTGGLIGSYYLAYYPHGIAKFVTTTPLFDASFGMKYPSTLLRAIFSFGSDEGYLPTRGPRDPSTLGFFDDTFTGSYNRWWLTNQLERSQPLIAYGGPTKRWAKQIYRATRPHRLDRLASRIEVPTLLFSGAEDDRLNNKFHDRFARGNGFTTHLVFPTARHEIAIERDLIRKRFVQEMLNFIN